MNQPAVERLLWRAGSSERDVTRRSFVVVWRCCWVSTHFCFKECAGDWDCWGEDGVGLSPKEC
jgi:hypothetical protein